MADKKEELVETRRGFATSFVLATLAISPFTCNLHKLFWRERGGCSATNAVDASATPLISLGRIGKRLKGISVSFTPAFLSDGGGVPHGVAQRHENTSPPGCGNAGVGDG